MVFLFNSSSLIYLLIRFWFILSWFCANPLLQLVSNLKKFYLLVGCLKLHSCFLSFFFYLFPFCQICLFSFLIPLNLFFMTGLRHYRHMHDLWPSPDVNIHFGLPQTSIYGLDKQDVQPIKLNSMHQTQVFFNNQLV